MNFETHNTTSINTGGSSLIGNVDATYKELNSLFGAPIKSDDGKTDAQWQIKFSDGTVASIYNWKDGKAYLGEIGKPVEQITDWHVGGFGAQALVLVQITLELMREAKPKHKMEEAFSSALDMMDSIKATKGREYAHLVEVAMLTIKRREMVELLIDMAQHNTNMPDSVRDLMLEADTAFSIKTISAACQASKFDFNAQDEAEELMGWAERMIKAEVGGVKELLKDKKK
jgi:hypothetical protein